MKQSFFGIDDAPVHPGDQSFVLGALGPVGRRILEPYLGAVEEEVQFFRGIVPDLLVKVEKPAVGIAYPAPAAFAEGYVMDGVFVVEALVEIHQLVDVPFAYFPET